MIDTEVVEYRYEIVSESTFLFHTYSNEHKSYASWHEEHCHYG